MEASGCSVSSGTVRRALQELGIADDFIFFFSGSKHVVLGNTKGFSQTVVKTKEWSDYTGKTKGMPWPVAAGACKNSALASRTILWARCNSRESAASAFSADGTQSFACAASWTIGNFYGCRLRRRVGGRPVPAPRGRIRKSSGAGGVHVRGRRAHHRPRRVVRRVRASAGGGAKVDGPVVISLNLSFCLMAIELNSRAHNFPVKFLASPPPSNWITGWSALHLPTTTPTRKPAGFACAVAGGAADRIQQRHGTHGGNYSRQRARTHAKLLRNIE